MISPSVKNDELEDRSLEEKLDLEPGADNPLNIGFITFGFSLFRYSLCCACSSEIRKWW